MEKRFYEHQTGMGANYTKKRLPVKLVYTEEFSRIDEAYYRERQIHNWGHEKKKALIEGDEVKLKELTQCRNDSHYLKRKSEPRAKSKGGKK